MANEQEITLSIEQLVKIGTEVALNKLEELKKERTKFRQDKRLRNTKMLLKNYKTLVLHCGEAIFAKKKSAIDILDQLEFETDNEEMYIESIKKSTERTAIIISHVNRMLGVLQIIDESKKNQDRPTKYEVLKILYIDEDNMTQEQIAELHHTSPKTIQRRKDEAIEDLSGLIFGIDGVKMR